MKRMTYFVMALALVLSLAQCKKEQLVEPTSEGNGVHITLDVNGDASTGSANKGTRVNVDPNGEQMVTFQKGDTIEVASNGLHVGTLIHDGAKFSGRIENATTGQPLYFYFFGNKTPQFFGEGKSNCSVYIGEQTKALPVISFSASTEDFQTDRTNYSAILQNKCSLMKFNVTTASTAPVCIDCMNNFVTVNFGSGNDGFSYSQKYDGVIKMKGQVGDGTKTYWAIVLPQDPIAAGDAYTEDYGFTGTRPAIGKIEANQYFSTGVDMTVNNPHNLLATPLTFEAKTAGATVTLSKAGTQSEQAPSVSLQININDGGWSTYTVGTTITLSNVGDKVMFRGTNVRYAISSSAYNKFSLGGACYVYGNIMSLINAENYASNTSLGDSQANQYTFACLFQNCTELYTHPIKTLKLPAIELANYCYSQMFYGCTHLTVAPELPTGEDPFDSLKEGCYQAMFQKCTSLEEAPKLPALVLVSNCYSNMFNGCANLRSITCLAIEGIGKISQYQSSTSNWMSNAGSNIDIEAGENPPMFYTNAEVTVEDPYDPEPEYTPGEYWPRDNNGIPPNWSYE